MIFFLTNGQGDTEMGNMKLMYILGAIPYIIIPFYYAKYRNYNISQLFRFKSVPAHTVLISFFIAVSLGVVSDEIDRLVQIFLPIPDFFQEIIKSMQADTMSDWLLLILGVVIFAAVSEEMVFRGFLQVTLEKRGDVTRAVLLSSLTWTMIHMNPYWAIQIFISGVIIGFVAWRTGSIIPAILIHGINNFMALLAYNNEPLPDWYTMGDHVTPELLIPSLAVLVYSIIKLNDYYRRKADIDLHL